MAVSVTCLGLRIAADEAEWVSPVVVLDKGAAKAESWNEREKDRMIKHFIMIGYSWQRNGKKHSEAHFVDFGFVITK